MTPERLDWIIRYPLSASTKDLVELARYANDLRAAVDAALALHTPLRDGPLSLIDYEYCSCRADEVHVDDDGKRSIGPAKYPCATTRALTPVADPDPHTTSDKETT
jgi:hypothetical protein